MNVKQPDNKSDDTRLELTRELEEKEQQRKRIMEINSLASTPVIADLAEAGFYLEWVSDLYSRKLNYKNAIPVLLKWLPRIDNFDVKEDIVRALSVPWAKSIAAPALIAEFYKVQNESNIGIKWTIADALSVVADDLVFMEIVDLVSDLRNGQAICWLLLGNSFLFSSG